MLNLVEKITIKLQNMRKLKKVNLLPFLLYYKMGNEYTKEFTVDYIERHFESEYADLGCTGTEDDKYYIIYTKGNIPLILMKNHPNRVALLAKLKTDTSHKFIINGNAIKDVQDCEIHHICGRVYGFIDISITKPDWKNAYKVLIHKSPSDLEHQKIDLIVNFGQMAEIKLNRTYDMYYVKAYGYDYYKVERFVDCGF